MTKQEEDRYISLYELFKSLAEDIGWGDSVYLNRALLRITVTSYFKDIVRFEDFHETERADQHKKAAFTIKWISKIKPVNIRVDDNDISKKEMLCNQLFAIISGLSFLKVDITKISSKFFEHLLYTSHYRDIDVLQMATSMYLLEKSMNKEMA